MVKSTTGYSSREFKFDSQQLSDISHPSVILVPGDLILFSGFHGHQALK